MNSYSVRSDEGSALWTIIPEESPVLVVIDGKVPAGGLLILLKRLRQTLSGQVWMLSRMMPSAVKQSPKSQ